MDKRSMTGRKHRPAGQLATLAARPMASFVVCATVLLIASLPARLLAEDSPIGRTPPRLSLVAGEVSYWRPGAADWAPAQLNTALAPGDALYTAAGAQLELQIGAQAYVRAAGATQLGLENQEPDFVQLTVTAGRAALDVRDVAPGRTVEIDTPNAAFIIQDPGYYRLEVAEDKTTFITRRGGRAQLRPARGNLTEVGANNEVTVEGTPTPYVSYAVARALDDWDRWNYDRTDQLLAAESWQYVPRGVYGADTLDDYGTWRVVPTYGRVWVPRAVPAGWAPYSTGRWVWDTYYGWTWVDTAPWGWAPYHYGRWVYLNSYWGWCPGPIVATPVYAPALVAFFGSGTFRIGVGFPYLSWVALGWGEPVVPWWGPAWYRRGPHWCSWGGPRIVNKVVVHNTKVIRFDRRPGAYQNTRIRHAVLTVPRDRFRARAIDRVRYTGANAHDLQVLGGDVPVRPSPSSRVPAVGRTVRPPNSVRGRRVVTAHTGGDSPRGRELTANRSGGAPAPGRNPAHPLAGLRADTPRRAASQAAPSEPGRSGIGEHSRVVARPAPPVAGGRRSGADVAGRTSAPSHTRIAEGRPASRRSDVGERQRPPAPPRATEQQWFTAGTVERGSPRSAPAAGHTRRAPEVATADRSTTFGQAEAPRFEAPQSPTVRQPRVQQPARPAPSRHTASASAPRARMDAAPSRRSYSRPAQPRQAPAHTSRGFSSRSFGSSGGTDAGGDSGGGAAPQGSYSRGSLRGGSGFHR